MGIFLFGYDLWGFQTGGTQLETFLPKNKGNNWILRIGLMGEMSKSAKI